MPESLDDFAPYPRREEDASADAMCRNLAVIGQAQFSRSLDGATPEQRSESIRILVDMFAIVRLLKFLQDFHKDVADDAARELWSDWEDGSGIGEWLWEWLTEYGIDPDEVSRVAEKQRAEHAAKTEATR